MQRDIAEPSGLVVQLPLEACVELLKVDVSWVGSLRSNSEVEGYLRLTDGSNIYASRTLFDIFGFVASEFDAVCLTLMHND
jgi:hypothetical protein